jgi:hypothetical protein
MWMKRVAVVARWMMMKKMNGRREEAQEAGAGCRWQEAGPDPTGRRGLAAEGSPDQQQLLRRRMVMKVVEKLKKMGWWGRSAASSVAA